MAHQAQLVQFLLTYTEQTLTWIFLQMETYFFTASKNLQSLSNGEDHKI